MCGDSIHLCWITSEKSLLLDVAPPREKLKVSVYTHSSPQGVLLPSEQPGAARPRRESIRSLNTPVLSVYLSACQLWVTWRATEPEGKMLHGTSPRKSHITAVRLCGECSNIASGGQDVKLSTVASNVSKVRKLKKCIKTELKFLQLFHCALKVLCILK